MRKLTLIAAMTTAALWNCGDSTMADPLATEETAADGGDTSDGDSTTTVSVDGPDDPLVIVEDHFVSQSGSGSLDGSSIADAFSLAQLADHADECGPAGTEDGLIGGGDRIWLIGEFTAEFKLQCDGEAESRIYISGNYPDHHYSYAGSKVTSSQNAFDLTGRQFLTLINHGDRVVVDGGHRVGRQCTDDDCLNNPYVPEYQNQAEFYAYAQESLTLDLREYGCNPWDPNYNYGPQNPSCSCLKADGTVYWTGCSLAYNNLIANLSNSHDIVIDNWEFRNSSRGIYAKDASYLTVRDCYFNHFANDGINIIDSHHLKIADNEFYRCTFKTKPAGNSWGTDVVIQKSQDVLYSHNYNHGTTDKPYDGWTFGGIRFYSVSRVIIENNTLAHAGARFNRGAIHSKNDINCGNNPDSLAQSSDVIIRFNHINNWLYHDGPLPDDPDSRWGYGGAGSMSLTRNAKNWRVYGNKITRTNSGFTVTIAPVPGQDTGKDGCHNGEYYIWANDFSNTRGSALSLSFGHHSTTDLFYDNHIWNNTFAHSEEGTALKIWTRPQNVDSDSLPAFRVHNNIFSHPFVDGEPSRSHSLKIHGETEPSHMEISHNLWFDPHRPGDFGVVVSSSSHHPTSSIYLYSERLSNPIPDAWFANALIEDPLFEDGPNNDMAPQPSSPARGGGRDMGDLAIPSMDMDPWIGGTQTFNPRWLVDPASTDWGGDDQRPDVVLVENTDNHRGAYW